MKYVLIGDDMFYRTLEGLLLKCLGPAESNRLLHEIHEGACGTHQSAHKMKWLIRRSGYYWPTMLEDCYEVITRFYKHLLNTRLACLRTTWFSASQINLNL